MKEYRVAVVGATGMVGRTFLQVLEKKNLPVSEYVLFASSRSAGTKLPFLGKEYTVQELNKHSFDSGFDIALFSAGGSISGEFAPIAAEKGCVVIDNSSMWRMHEDVPLVVPEVNPEDILKHKGIIANPNCSTIQAVVALKPLNDKYSIKRIVYTTFQVVSGAGVNGYADLEKGAKAFAEGSEYTPKKFPHPIFNNCLPHIDVFQNDGYTKEEQKMIDETKKILHDDLLITATCVRVPVFNSHSESINVEFYNDFDMEEVRQSLRSFPGIILMDDAANEVYPMPITATGHDEVYIGRLRRDTSAESALNMWVVADNIRKGAASNAVQIAEKLIGYWENN